MATASFPSLLLLLLPLLSTSAFARIWNIDCGATDGFLEDGTKLTWVGDGDYVKSGTSYTLTSTDARSLTTLRAFPKYRKNCYSVRVGAKTKVQVWMSFYYGDYDDRGKPPSFELLLDGNDWDTIETEMDGTVYRTVIYTAERDTTDICLGRIYDDDDPFVSSIQVVSYGREMYSKVNSTVALYSPFGYAFGANDYFRYPDDPYDRVWSSIDSNILISTYKTLQHNATTVLNTSTCPDDPPAKLFDNAIVPRERSRNLTITATFLSSIPHRIYLNLYFTETNASLSGKRKIDIYMDDKLISDAPMAPVFGAAIEFSYVTSAPTVSNATRITLAPANGSSLPPIISGLETFYMRKFSSDATDAGDVGGLLKLQNKFETLKNWSGDPCYPKSYSWEWVNCSDAEPARVITLSLGGYVLSGRLPDFSDLNALVTIDLQSNNLSGSIPDFISKLPSLLELNLAFNNFSSIPPSLSANKRISLNITGNPLLDPTFAKGSEGPAMAPPPPSGSEEKTTPMFVLWILFIVWIMM